MSNQKETKHVILMAFVALILVVCITGLSYVIYDKMKQSDTTENDLKYIRHQDSLTFVLNNIYKEIQAINTKVTRLDSTTSSARQTIKSRKNEIKNFTISSRDHFRDSVRRANHMP